jgi:hypothetical protein
MSELMASVRAARRLIPAGAKLPTDVDRAALIALAALCAVLFISFFALARVLSPASIVTDGASPRIEAAPASDQVPLRLSDAPAIQTGVSATPKPAARAAPARRAGGPAQQVAGSNAQSPAQASTPTTTAAPVTPVPASTTPAAAPEAKAPEPRRVSPPPRKSSGGGGTFDSSG